MNIVNEIVDVKFLDPGDGPWRLTLEHRRCSEMLPFLFLAFFYALHKKAQRRFYVNVL